MTDSGPHPKPDSVAYSQLERDFALVSEQFAATNEVLTAVGRSAGHPDGVLETIVESACRLCNAQACLLYTFDGTYYRPSKSVGVSADFMDYMAQHPILPDRNSLAGRAGLDRDIQQIVDVFADPDYGRRDMAELAGYRTVMTAPMLLDDEVVGALTLWRDKVDPFDDRAKAILGTFCRAGRYRAAQRQPGP